MIDIKFLRENPEIVKQNIRNKFQDSKLPLVDEVIALDEELRQNKKRADDLRANRNKISKSIGMLMGQKKFEEAEEAKKLVAAQAEELKACEALEAELEEVEAELNGSAASDYMRAAELDARKTEIEDRLMELYELQEI